MNDANTVDPIFGNVGPFMAGLLEHIAAGPSPEQRAETRREIAAEELRAQEMEDDMINACRVMRGPEAATRLRRDIRLGLETKHRRVYEFVR